MTSSVGNGTSLSWQFWKELTAKIWKLSKFSAISFYYKVWQEHFHTDFWPFSKNILILSVRNRESLTNFRTISANRDKKLTESVKSITMWDRTFYKVLQILQIRHKKVQIPLAACRRIAIVRTFSSSHSRK